MNTQMDDTAHAGVRRPVTITLAEIDDSDRLRPVDMEAVARLRLSLAALGQKTPIEVTGFGADGRRRLVSGAHRVEAARQLGWTTLDAIEIDGTADELRLHEIDENLVRHELTPFDQAVFLAERAAIYRRMNPEARRGRNQHTRRATPDGGSAKLADPTPRAFAEDVANKIGFSPRTVWRALTRFEKLSPEARTVVRGSEIAANGAALDALLKVPAARQARVAREALTRDVNAPLAERMAAAKERVLGVRRPAPDRVAAAKAAYDRLGPEERAAFVEWLRKTGQLGRRAAPAEADGE